MALFEKYITSNTSLKCKI